MKILIIFSAFESLFEYFHLFFYSFWMVLETSYEQSQIALVPNDWLWIFLSFGMSQVCFLFEFHVKREQIDKGRRRLIRWVALETWLLDSLWSYFYYGYCIFVFGDNFVVNLGKKIMRLVKYICYYSMKDSTRGDYASKWIEFVSESSVEGISLTQIEQWIVILDAGGLSEWLERDGRGVMW